MEHGKRVYEVEVKRFERAIDYHSCKQIMWRCFCCNNKSSIAQLPQRDDYKWSSHDASEEPTIPRDR